MVSQSQRTDPDCSYISPPYNDPIEVIVRSRIHYFFLFLTLLACMQAPARAQQSQQPSPVVPSSPDGPTDADEARTRIIHDMEKKAAKERIASLRSDTDKLLKLSVELKSYVDKADENVLSLEVVKKAEEIEKLAKSVKEKMKGPN